MQDHKKIIEALIFASEEPLAFKDLKKVFPEIVMEEVERDIVVLNEEYANTGRPFSIKYIAEGWQMTANDDMGEWIQKLFADKKKGKLSKAALEILSIVAYKQPVTKAEIEAIRGVAIDMNVLLEKNYVKILGRKDVPGKPILYGTTTKFLEYFGLSDIKSLPKLEEFEEAPSSVEVGEENGTRIDADLADLHGFNSIKN